MACDPAGPHLATETMKPDLDLDAYLERIRAGRSVWPRTPRSPGGSVRFILKFFHPIEFEPVNYYYSTSPDSCFVQRRLRTLPTTEGYWRLHGRRLTVQSQDRTVQETAHSEEEYRERLQRHFSIELNGGFVQDCPPD